MAKKNFIIIKLVIAGCVILLSSGCSLFLEKDKALKPPLLKPIKENFETYKVERGTIIRSVKGTGQFESINHAYHQFKVSGAQIVEVIVKKGDLVKKGDVLIKLEIEGLDLEIKNRLVELEKKKIGLDEAKNNRDIQSMKIKMLELEIARIEYEKTLDKLNSKQLTAQMDGQVEYVVEMKPGDWVEPYQLLVSIGDPQQMRVSYQANNPQDIVEVKVGMEALITFKGKSYKGKVVQSPSSAPLVENQQLREKYAKTLYVSVEDAPDEATFESSADITITLEKRENALIIPTKGLRSYFGRNYVQVLDGISRTEADVEKGIQSATQLDILTGLEEGQIIILQ